jgi:hypothetical protein
MASRRFHRLWQRGLARRDRFRRVTLRRLSGESIDDANVILNRDKAEEFETADYTCHGGFGVNAESRKLIIARAFAGGE